MINVYCNVTKKIQSGLDRIWEEATLSGELSKTVSVTAYLKLLQDHRNWNTLSFSLRRYLYLRFTERSPEDEPVPYTVNFHGHLYEFSTVSPDAEISDREKNAYAELMYQISMHNRCFKYVNGTVDPRESAISKPQFLNYLKGQRIFREQLFVLSTALGFDMDTMKNFMSMIGESPAYNFRCAEDCIYYFSQCLPCEERRGAVLELSDYYAKLRRSAPMGPPTGAGMTVQLGYALDDIIYDEELSQPERWVAFTDFLQENVSQFVRYCKTARQLLAKELNSEELLDTERPRRAAAKNDPVQASFIHPDHVEALLPDKPGALGDGVYDEVIERAYRKQHGEKLMIRSLDLEHRMTLNLTNSAHFRKIFAGLRPGEPLNDEQEQPVRKQDFLLVRLQKFASLLYANRYSPEERLALIKKFRSSTDRILTEAGLPMIYVANPFDHMILTALCHDDPMKFTQNLYYLAAKEDTRES